MSKKDELELLKLGNEQTIRQMKSAKPQLNPDDTCTPKHKAIYDAVIDSALVPFAERTFALHEMQFAKEPQTSRMPPLEIPTPWGTMKGEGRDLYRIVAILCMSFIIWILWTDKEERRQVRDDLKQFRQVEHVSVQKTAQVARNQEADKRTP
jgi:hypothetical protein